MYRSNEACCSVLSTSPVVESQITTSYCARFSSLKAAASSVTSTVKPFSVPSFSIAAMPAGIASCRNPAVLEKISASKGAAAASWGTTTDVVADWAAPGVAANAAAPVAMDSGSATAVAATAATVRIVARGALQSTFLT
ncbi:hypothetical protein D3C74_274970 [compost metagenome]